MSASGSGGLRRVANLVLALVFAVGCTMMVRTREYGFASVCAAFGFLALLGTRRKYEDYIASPQFKTQVTYVAFDGFCWLSALIVFPIRLWDFLIGHHDGRMGLKAERKGERLLAFAVVLYILLSGIVFGMTSVGTKF